jgi:HEAT repeat protein
MRKIILIAYLAAAAGCASPSTDDWLMQLKDADVVKRRQAIRELGARKEESERIIPALTSALGDESLYVRRDAAWALGNFGAYAQEATGALNAALQDESSPVRIAAAHALKKIK